MNPQELRALKLRHKLTGRHIAEICGVNPRTVRAWLDPGGPHARPMPYAAARLLAITVREEPCPPEYEPRRTYNRKSDQ